MTCNLKIVVFDLDETLGYFMELGMFWDALKSYIKYKQLKIPTNQSLFNSVLDLYPEFLRPNINEILNYIKKKKDKSKCDKLMIYTNNQGPSEWAKYIINYFEEKVQSKIFDQIIGAFKIQGRQVELCRTTHLKTHADFIKCTKMPENTQICYLDDVYYPNMSNELIYYINVRPYIHDLDFNEMINRFIDSEIIESMNLEETEFKEFIETYMNRYNYIYVQKSSDSQMIDEIVSKKILEHLHVFFKSSPIGVKKKSNRHMKISNRKTIKLRKKQSYID